MDEIVERGMDDMSAATAPPARELVRAYRTVRKLVFALYPGLTANDELWGDVIEAGRQIAIATSYLGLTDARYAAAWKSMMEGDK